MQRLIFFFYKQSALCSSISSATFTPRSIKDIFWKYFRVYKDVMILDFQIILRSLILIWLCS